ncbi:MAG: hypothetical protein U5R31_07085 [Acidimicrobiia bacterium]|nr:hypothetical protein [Acidimicrobiia bacterium]
MSDTYGPDRAEQILATIRPTGRGLAGARPAHLPLLPLPRTSPSSLRVSTRSSGPTSWRASSSTR